MEDGFAAGDTPLVSLESNVLSGEKVPVDPSRLTLGIKCIVSCGCVRCLPVFNGAQIHWGR